MRELVRTNDLVLVSVVGSLLDAARIHHLVFDQNMSVVEGSLGVLPRRVLVADEDVPAAGRVLADAGLAHELRPEVLAGLSFDTTRDAVLGGRLFLRQPKRGHRVGHDAILLAAATEAHAGEHAVDLGAGVGSAGLALASRVPDLRVTLVDIDSRLCDLARENVQTNGFHGRVGVLNLDVSLSGAFDAAGLGPGSVQRVLMNPPFNDSARQNVSPDALRRLAHAAPRDALPLWVNTAQRLLSPDGVLTLIWRADGLQDVLSALRAFGGVGVIPVHPRPEADAIRVLVRARKGSTLPLITFPPLFLNTADGEPSPEAEAILRGAQPLPFAEH